MWCNSLSFDELLLQWEGVGSTASTPLSFTLLGWSFSLKAIDAIEDDVIQLNFTTIVCLSCLVHPHMLWTRLELNPSVSYCLCV